MKLSALAALIKDTGTCEVIHDGERVFICTGSAIYAMDGYPKAKDSNELAAMLGISQKKMNSIYYNEERTIDGSVHSINLADDPEQEWPTAKLDTRLIINEEEHIALRNPNGSIGFVRAALLKPVEGELNKEYAAVVVREVNRKDTSYVYAVKDGMFLRAIIAPTNINDRVADDLNEILASLMEKRQKKIIEDTLREDAAREAAENEELDDE